VSCHLWYFAIPPSEPRLRLLEYPALQYLFHYGVPLGWFATMDGRMAATADHQGLTSAVCHHLDPEGRVGSPMAPQVFQGSDVMDLDRFLRATQLAGGGQQSSFEFCAWSTEVQRRAIQGYLHIP